jgi:hypothetical protein
MDLELLGLEKLRVQGNLIELELGGVEDDLRSFLQDIETMH